jgi:uncharacterized protein (UPF0303 family)
MDQDTKPAPFNLGDHVRYIAATRRALPVQIDITQENRADFEVAHAADSPTV